MDVMYFENKEICYVCLLDSSLYNTEQIHVYLQSSQDTTAKRKEILLAALKRIIRRYTLKRINGK